MSFVQLISKHPTGAMLTHKLEKVLRPQPLKPAYYSLDRICEEVEPKSRDELILALGKLVRSGRIKKIIRVVSPTTQGGIGDFNSLEEVPKVIPDYFTGNSVEVTPNNLRLLYVVPAANDEG